MPSVCVSLVPSVSCILLFSQQVSIVSSEQLILRTSRLRQRPFGKTLILKNQPAVLEPQLVLTGLNVF